jgi:mannose PTS system EIIA component
LIGILVVTHGPLARELVAAAEKIAGPQPNLRALALDWTEDLESARTRIGAELAVLDNGEGVLVLTDMFGDTPSNAAFACCRSGRVELVTGVNLPMVVRLACAQLEKRSLADLARWIEVKGRRAIRRATPLTPTGGVGRERPGG